MTFWQAFVLAVVQGLTEFFPVSSSGHLALARAFMKGFTESGLAFEVVVHLGTLLAVVAYFKKDFAALLGFGSDSPLAGHEIRFLRAVVIASVPTGILGLALRGAATRAFDNLLAVGGCLIVTGALLYVTAALGRKEGGAGIESLSWRHALIVGAAQGLAVFPGISRSGATIAAGILAGLDRRLAFSFSFLLSVPAIVGATALEARHITLAVFREGGGLPYTLAFVVSAVVGYGALMVLRRFVEAMKFSFFAYYCVAVGGFALAAWWTMR